MGPNGLLQLLCVPEEAWQRNPGVGTVGRQHDGRVALLQRRRQGGNVSVSQTRLRFLTAPVFGPT